MVIYVFFMIYSRLVIACNEAGCTFVSPEKFAIIAVAGGIELVLEIKNIIGIYRKKE